MDAVPFAFINSVAHFLSKESASLLSELHNRLWSSIGETHNTQRVENTLVVSVFPGGIQGYVRIYGSIASSIQPRNFETDSTAFDRIVNVDLYLSTRRNQDRDDTEVIRRLMNFHPVKHLTVSNAIPTTSLLAFRFLWEQEYRTVGINNNFACNFILDYHLLENSKLDKVMVRQASYDFMKKLSESFKLGQKQQLWRHQRTNKRFRDLAELGFQLSRLGGMFMELRCDNEATGKIVTFVGSS
ncbi:hypothetical protein L596_009841 [Steinernema carpocapsae]|uniref:Uncharacterized protein n=1 Tax=Steinernema carpocapsae TaxID=34508 RepID=A0A4U5PHC0_STECR|nr:hypothetical protein L596_009841 [Steinernema carpocapsae]